MLDSAPVAAMSYIGTVRDEAEIKKLIEAMHPYIHWALSSELGMKADDIAEISSKGWRGLTFWSNAGDKRAEVITMAADLLDIPTDTKEGKTLLIQVASAWSLIKEHVTTLHNVETAASAAGVALPLDQATAKATQMAVVNVMPGRCIPRNLRPAGAYLGVIEARFKLNDPRPEKLSHVASVGDL